MTGADASASPVLQGRELSGRYTLQTAEIIFLNPADMNPAIAELIELDFDVEVLDDWIDDEGPAMWILAHAITELDDRAFFDHVQAIVEPLGGDVGAAGYATATALEMDRVH